MKWTLLALVLASTASAQNPTSDLRLTHTSPPCVFVGDPVSVEVWLTIGNQATPWQGLGAVDLMLTWQPGALALVGGTPAQPHWGYLFYQGVWPNIDMADGDGILTFDLAGDVLPNNSVHFVGTIEFIASMAMDTPIVLNLDSSAIPMLPVYVSAVREANFPWHNTLGQVGMPVAQTTCGLSCYGLPNSTGGVPAIRLIGSASLADGQLDVAVMGATGFGVFMRSKTLTVFNPPGSSGIMCLLNPIYDYGSLFLGNGVSSVDPRLYGVPGDSWHFQAWYRDGATSNFTDTVSVYFVD